MADPGDPETPPDLWDRMTAEGHAAFTLVSATRGIDLRSDRERELVATAIAAGVVGALEVMRQDEHEG